MENIYIIGVGMTFFGRQKEKSIKDLTREAVQEALQDAGIEHKEIQAAYVGNTAQGLLEDQYCISGPIALRNMGFEGIPMLTVENACATASTAFYLAIHFLQSGQGDVAMAVGVEKLNTGPKDKRFAIFDGCWDVYLTEESTKKLLSMAEGFEVPPGTQTTEPYSVFMDIYAAGARWHMQKYGTTQRQIAAVASSNHNNSKLNPLAQYQIPLTIEQVLAAPPITYPLTMPMCSPISDGAAAAIICTEDGLKRLGLDKKRAIKVYASVLGTGISRDDNDETKNIASVAAAKAYEMAGLGPEDMSVAEVHDATACGQIFQVENLGFCARGMGGPCSEAGDFSLGGRLPVNPSGGLLSKGHPIGATGLGQVWELVTQLRGEAGARQVEGARFAIQENGGGVIGLEEAVCYVGVYGKCQ